MTELSLVDINFALRETVTGEVRCDRLSRALYSTEASVYRIVPQGVIRSKTEGDILARLAACARFLVPLTARGGGTTQHGFVSARGAETNVSA